MFVNFIKLGQVISFNKSTQHGLKNHTLTAEHFDITTQSKLASACVQPS